MDDSPDEPDMSLPEEDWANLARFAEDNARVAALQKAGHTPRIVLMGNSITEGWPRTDTTFASRNLNYINRGISGQTTEQMLVRYRPDVLALDPDVVVLHAGVNDFAFNTGHTTPDETFGNLLSMVQLARVNNIKVVLASLPETTSFHWRPGVGNPKPGIHDMNTRLKKLAQDLGIPFADYHAALSDGNRDVRPEYAADLVHPTLAGYQVMEKVLHASLREALE